MKRTYTIDTPATARMVSEVIKELAFSPLQEVVIQPHKKPRSLRQNSLLHMWCGQISTQIAEAYGKFYPAEHWKEYLKSMFLGEETIVVGKRTITRTRPTAGLKVGEFAEFLTNIDLYCGSELNVELTHPEDLYREAMGIKEK